jgi:hypothetical protein
MPRAPFLIAAAVVAAALARAAGLLLDPDPFSAGSAAVIAAWFAVFGLITVTGFLVARARWARVAGLVLVAASLALGLVVPLGPLGWIALVAAGIALAGLAGPWPTRRWLRLLPSAQGPPPSAVALVLGLLGLPAIVALARPDGLGAADWIVVAAAPLLSWAVSRALAAGLWLVRLALPAAAAVAGIAAGLPGGPIVAAAGIALSALAWTPSVARSVSPLIPERVPAVPVPPELVSPDVLRAAGYDERGRPVQEEL